MGAVKLVIGLRNMLTWVIYLRLARRMLLLGLTISLIVSVLPLRGSAAPVFSDISKHWAEVQIEQAVAKGYVSGFPDGTFRPNDSVTVAQFLTMMFLSFTDVKEDGKRDWSDTTLIRVPESPREDFFTNHVYDFGQGTPWYSNYVESAKFLGVINDWEFEDRYNEALTREKASKIINLMAVWFDGVVHDEYAKLAVTKMKDYAQFSNPGRAILGAESMIRGILSGYPDGNFQPKRAITRAEAISVIERINNNELRKPITVNLEGVPYSKVFYEAGRGPRVHVFANWEMKNVYDQLRKDLQYETGAIEQFGASHYYYKDYETLLEGVKDRRNPSQWYLGKIYYDMIISASSNVYGINLSGEEGRFERRSESLLRFLNSVFKEKGTEVHQLIADSIKKHNSQTLSKVDKIIENRQVVIYSSQGGLNIIHIAISGYADK